MEDDGDDSNTKKATPFDGFDFYLDFVIDLQFCLSIAIIFFGVDVVVFVMVYSMRDYWKCGCLVFEEEGCLFYL